MGGMKEGKKLKVRTPNSCLVPVYIPKEEEWRSYGENLFYFDAEVSTPSVLVLEDNKKNCNIEKNVTVKDSNAYFAANRLQKDMATRKLEVINEEKECNDNKGNNNNDLSSNGKDIITNNDKNVNGANIITSKKKTDLGSYDYDDEQKQLTTWTETLVYNLQQQQSHAGIKKLSILQRLQKENMNIQSNINTLDYELNVLHNATKEYKLKETYKIADKSSLIEKNEILKDKIYLLKEKQKQHQQISIIKEENKKIKHAVLEIYCRKRKLVSSNNKDTISGKENVR